MLFFPLDFLTLISYNTNPVAPFGAHPVFVLFFTYIYGGSKDV